jgi:YaiO family outer membrane protein
MLTRPTTTLRAAALAAVIWTAGAGFAAAQVTPFVDLSGDLSPVTIGTYETQWQVGRVTGGVLDEGRYGITMGAERHRRDRLVDWAGHAGGFRRVGDWTFAAAAGYSDRPEFLYRLSLEGEVARRVAGGLVLHGGYRHLDFPAADVHLVQPAVSYYFSRGDVQARGYFVNNTTANRRSNTLLLRGGMDLTPWLRVSGGAAAGTRIFDAAALQDTRAQAWVAFASASVQFAPQWRLTVGAGSAHEDPLFSQRTVSLGVRWTLR